MAVSSVMWLEKWLNICKNVIGDQLLMDLVEWL